MTENGLFVTSFVELMLHFPHGWYNPLLLLLVFKDAAIILSFKKNVIMKKAVLFSVFAFVMGFAFAQSDAVVSANGNLAETVQVGQNEDVQPGTMPAEDPMTYWEFKQKVKQEKGTFLEVGSMAYLKYKSYNTMKICGWTFLATGFALAVPVGIPLYLCLWNVYSYYDYTGVGHIWVQNDVPGIVCMSVGGGFMVAGAILLGCMGSQLQQSYHYYVQGQKKSVSLNWHPTFGTDYAGMGLTVRF